MLKNLTPKQIVKELDRLFDVRFTDKMKNDFQLIKHLLGSKNSSEVIAKKIIDVI